MSFISLLNLNIKNLRYFTINNINSIRFLSIYAEWNNLDFVNLKQGKLTLLAF